MVMMHLLHLTLEPSTYKKNIHFQTKSTNKMKYNQNTQQQKKTKKKKKITTYPDISQTLIVSSLLLV